MGLVSSLWCGLMREKGRFDGVKRHDRCDGDEVR